jgi:hypothetical protein
MKYVHTQYDRPEQVLERLYHDETLGLRKAFAIVHKELDDRERSDFSGAIYPRGPAFFLDLLTPDDDLDDEDTRAEDDEDDEDDDVEKQVDHHASVVANLLVESGRFPDRPAALHHLLHKPGGQALLARLHKAAKTEKESNMDTIHAIMKSGGIAATCACIVAKGETSISEHDLVAAATAVASERHPGLSPSQAFSKIYSAATDEARVLRDAINVAKATTVISGGDWRDAGDAAQAMDQLCEIGRRMAPTATPAKQFSVAFEDPKNIALALRAYRRPSGTTTSFPFPVR